MSTFLPLPPISVTAAADQTGRNPGNWTCAFTSSVLAGVHVPFYELYHATVTEVPAGSSGTIENAAGYQWGFTAPSVGQGAEYHLGGSGWILTAGQEFYVFWTSAATGTPPIFTAWFRYDLDIPANRRAA